jgi:hypothetical protein
MPAAPSRQAEIWRFAWSILLTIATLAAIIHFVVSALRASHVPTPPETHVLRLRGHGQYFSDSGWQSSKRDALVAAGAALLQFIASLTRLRRNGRAALQEDDREVKA